VSTATSFRQRAFGGLLAAGMLLCVSQLCAAQSAAQIAAPPATQQQTAPAAAPAPQTQQRPLHDAGGETRVPQTLLSTCAALQVVTRQDMTPGMLLAVSPDGQFRAAYFYTGGAVTVLLHDRDTQDEQRIELPLQAIPPGIEWRLVGAEFSSDGDWLAVHGTGTVWVIDTSAAELRSTISFDTAKQLYPGQMTWSDNLLGVLFWPPESVLADAPPKGPVDFGIYDPANAKLLHTVPLTLAAADSWNVISLSPDAKRVAVLERAQKWPGSSRLRVISIETGKALWDRKVDGEDMDWSADGSQILVLSGKLSWLDAATGKEVRTSRKDLGASDYQKLRFSNAGNLAAGILARYSRFSRLFGDKGQREWTFALWQMSTGAQLCEVPLDAAITIDPWVTARGEVVTLEQTYDLRPPLRLLKSSVLVSYRYLPMTNTVPAKPQAAAKPH
jgi:hypothetical protein